MEVSDSEKIASEIAYDEAFDRINEEACIPSGCPSPSGDTAHKWAEVSSGGEKVCSVSVKTSSCFVNSTTSDELINYSDTFVKETSEEVS